jgi:predicted metal-dependent peptidase
MGGGGTSFIPVFEYVNVEARDAKLLIYFTDGYGSFPEPHDVEIPTIWVSTSRGAEKEHYPFGTVIKIEDKT